MIEGLQPYAEYKPSGQEWLGAIPRHWELRRTKFILCEVDSRTSTGKDQLLRVSQYTGVTERRSADGTDVPDTRAASLVGYKRVKPNDLVINIMLAWNGSLGVSRYNGIASPAYCVYRFRPSAFPWYFHHLLRLPLYKGRIKAASTGVVESRLRLYSDDLGRIEALLPPLDEQAAIVRFLDQSNGKIERFIRAKRKLIGLLNEQKQTIIHRAVTRGLKPDAPLKPSGIPWLGDIPKHWGIRQVRRVASFVTSGSRSWADYYSDSGLVFIQSGNLGRNMVLNLDYIQHVRPPAGAEGERTRVQRDDVLICITGALTGNVVHVDTDLPGPSFVNQHVALLRVRQSAVEPRFLAFSLRSEVGQGQFKTSEYGGTKQGLGLGDVKDVYFPLPPPNEREAIVSHLDSTLALFNAAITRTEREMALMHEFCTRLTADVVTGKLDVRAAAAKLPEISPEDISAVETPVDDEESDAGEIDG